MGKRGVGVGAVAGEGKGKGELRVGGGQGGLEWRRREIRGKENFILRGRN